MNNFDLKKYLAENKLTTNSRLLNEFGGAKNLDKDGKNRPNKYKNNMDKVSTDKVLKYIYSQENELKKTPKLWGTVQFFMGQLDKPETSMYAGYSGDKSKLDAMVDKLEDENEFNLVIRKAFDAATN